MIVANTVGRAEHSPIVPLARWNHGTGVGTLATCGRQIGFTIMKVSRPDVQTSRGLKFCNPYILRADRCVGSHPTFWLVGASHFMYCHDDCLAIARADLVQTWMRWHKHVLSAASPYFRTMLLSYLEEGSREYVTIGQIDSEIPKSKVWSERWRS